MAPFRILAIVLFAGWTISVQASDEIAFTPAQMQRLGVTTAEVGPGRAMQTDTLQAQVVIPPDQEQVVSAPRGGLILALHAAAEEPIQQGDPLVEVRSSELLKSQQAFLRARSTRELTAASLQRDRQLYDEGIIPERRFQETRSRFQQARFDLAAQRQSLLLAGMSEAGVERLGQSGELSGRLQIRAPMDGVVLETLARPGQWLERAAPLYRIARLDHLWLEIRVPLEHLQGVTVGVPVSVPCAGTEATVSRVGRTAEARSQTVLVRAELSGGGTCLRPGQYVETRLEVGTGTGRFRVPEGAVVRNRGKQWVFVRQARGFLPVAVIVHGRQEGSAVVSGAIQSGQSVAVSGLAAIKGAWSGYGGGE